MALTLGILLIGALIGLILEALFSKFFVVQQNPAADALTVSLQDAKAESFALQEQVKRLEAQLASATHTIAEQKQTLQGLETALADVQEAQEVCVQEQTLLEQALNEAQQTLAKRNEQLSLLDNLPPTPVANPAPVMTPPAAVVEPAVDDFTRLSGIGPKLAEAMQTLAITSYSELAALSAEDIGQGLTAKGIRYNKALLESWPAQAALAAKSDWDGLKAYQIALKN